MSSKWSGGVALHWLEASRPEDVPPTLAPSRSLTVWPSRIVAAVLIVLGFCPVVNWIPEGRSAPWYGAVAGEWLNGSLIAIGVGVVVAILSRHWAPNAGRVAHWTARAAARPRLTGWVLAGVALLLYATVARVVFSGIPLHLDELAQVIQARIFAAGSLYLDPGVYPEFKSALHLLDEHGRWFTQFPPGGPLMLVPGVWLGATWIVGPVTGAMSVALFWAIIRRVEHRPSVALGGTLVFALAPFVVFMSASHMNHAGALLWALVATYALVRMSEGTRFAALLGASLGILATVRPVDALAFAVPAGVWMLWRLFRGVGGVRQLGVAGATLSLALGTLAWYNWRTTGNPTLFAYEALWGPEHALGFHAAPWGVAHTPGRGLELLSLYFLRLQTYWLETPIPSLALPFIGLFATHGSGGIARYWLSRPKN